MLITQKKGTLRIADASGKLSEEITGIPPVNDSGQGGLLELQSTPILPKTECILDLFR
ncbi:PQQ-dependent sugar dehydrogenase [Cohnella faecalis]|uniref:PQQ-dependent sugar dehydrogenase n=1 Tax=Cohnella faecalis TaxID=2315694 RepID=UPI003989560E